MKIVIRSIVAVIVLLCTLFLWLTRDPTTQLIDASGNELTAGSRVEREAELVRSSPLDEARTLIERKEFGAAKERLLRIIEESDHDGEACILVSDVSRELKDVATAVDYGLKATKLLPDSAEAHLAYAKAVGFQMFINSKGIGGMIAAMTQMGHFKEELDRVIDLDPEDIEARTMKVLCNLAPGPFGNIELAIEVSREIEARDAVRGKQMLAACYRRNKETGRAIALLREGIEEYPEGYVLHLALADIYAEEKRFEAADADYEAARQGGKGAAYYRSLYEQARMRIQNEIEPDRAVELLDEFIADEPDGDDVPSVAHACWRKGNALEQLGRNEDARVAYRESLRWDPGLKLAETALKGLRE